MGKSRSSFIPRLLALYKVLPRYPKSSISIEQLKNGLRSHYSDQIDEQSLTKAIRRDLELLPELFISGQLKSSGGIGNKPIKYHLSQDVLIEPFSAELALVLVMANEYLHQHLPNETYSKVEGFFKSAESQLQKSTQLNGWKNRLRSVSDGYAEIKKTKHQSEMQELIYEALLNGDVWLQGKYRKERVDYVSDYILKPHGIVQFGQIPYLIASKIVGDKSILRTFNMLYFEQLEIIPEKISIDIATYDLDVLVKNREFENTLFSREELGIFFVFEEDLLGELVINPIGDLQDIQKIDDGFYELRATCMLSNSRVEWFVKNAHLIQILAPDVLREEIVDRASIALEKNDLSDPYLKFEKNIGI